MLRRAFIVLLIFWSHDPCFSHTMWGSVVTPRIISAKFSSYPGLTKASLPFSCRECRSRNIFPNDGSTNGLWAILLRSNDRVCRKSSRSRNTTLALPGRWWPRRVALQATIRCQCRPRTDQWHPGAREYFCELPAENCSGLLEIVPSCRHSAHNRPRQMMEKLSIALRHQTSASRLETQNQQISTNTFIESVIYHVAKINPLAREVFITAHKC